MSEIYDKKVVLKAAYKTVQACRAERAALLAEWDSKSLIFRFTSGFCGVIRPDHHGVTREKLAERIHFKAAYSLGDGMSLTNDEIDAIKEWWLIEETIPHE